MALPLVVMGAGMGFIVAPLTDAVLSEVPREHSGSASGLINTVQQMGNALGLGLVSVVFFGEISDRLTLAQVGPAFANAFEHALGWVAAVLTVIFLLMFALPKQPAQHVEGAQDEPDAQDQSQDQDKALGKDKGQDQDRKPEFVG
jgi:MFS family permease